MEMETDTSRLSSTDEILQPECLSLEDIKKFLVGRGVLLKDLPSDRGGLLSLYNRLILPLPQREYKKSSRVGKKFRRKSPDKQTMSSIHNNSSSSNGNATTQSKSLKNVQPDRHNLKTKHEPSSKESGPDIKKSRMISWP